MGVKVKLSTVLEAMEAQSEELHAYIDTATGEVIPLAEEHLRAAEDGEEGDRWADWEKQAVKEAAAVLADEGGRYLAVPTEFEIDEWQMMERFARDVEDAEASDILWSAIHGSGAFRRFKDATHSLGIADEWYAYHDQQYRNIAIEWCEEHGIEYIDD